MKNNDLKTGYKVVIPLSDAVFRPAIREAEPRFRYRMGKKTKSSLDRSGPIAVFTDILYAIEFGASLPTRVIIEVNYKPSHFEMLWRTVPRAGLITKLLYFCPRGTDVAEWIIPTKVLLTRTGLRAPLLFRFPYNIENQEEDAG